MSLHSAARGYARTNDERTRGRTMRRASRTVAAKAQIRRTWICERRSGGESSGASAWCARRAARADTAAGTATHAGSGAPSVNAGIAAASGAWFLTLVSGFGAVGSLQHPLGEEAGVPDI